MPSKQNLSKVFIDFQNNFQIDENHLIDGFQDSSITGIPTPHEAVLASCMIVIFHAHLEDYFEGIAKEMYSRKTFSKSVNEYLDLIISRNHGIKPINLYQLFLPITSDKKHIDPMLLDQIESLAAQRGAIAHTRTKHKSTIPQAKQTIKQLLNLVKNFDITIRSH